MSEHDRIIALHGADTMEARLSRDLIQTGAVLQAAQERMASFSDATAAELERIRSAASVSTAD